MTNIAIQPQQTQLLRQLLVRHAAELSASRHGLRSLSTEGADTAYDSASSTLPESRSLGAAMASLSSRTVQLIEGALGRVQAGTYGRCSDCDRPIPVARLRAVPFADSCRECQERRDLVGRGTPILA